MILELVLALGLAQGDSSLVRPSALALDAHAVDDTYASWRDVLAARAPANAAGFGSVAVGNGDGTYTLRYVFKGSVETVQSQLDRLNDVLDKNLVLYVPPTSPLEGQQNPDQALAEGQEPRNLPKANPPIESPSEVQESNTQISTPEAPVVSLASLPKDSAPVKEAAPVEAEALAVRDESLEVPFAIVFGSYEVKANAERKKAAMIRAGQPAVVLQNGGFYRVGVVYNSYPGKELREFKNQGKVCWLLRRD